MIKFVGWTAMILLLSNSLPAQVTERLSVNNQGQQANSAPNLFRAMGSSMSADGRYVTFSSSATNLCQEYSTWNNEDVFLRDAGGRVTTLISASLIGMPGNGYQTRPCISSDGRFVAFESTSKDLTNDGLNNQGYWQIFVRDWQNGTTEWLSPPFQGIGANDDCILASISGDGRLVTFESVATDLVEGGTNSHRHVFLRDRQSNVTTVISVGMGGFDVDGDCRLGVISSDGRFVTFSSNATNLVPGGGGGQNDIYVRDLVNGTNELVSVGLGGEPSNGDSQVSSISADGRFVAFWSTASNLVTGDTNQCEDVFVRDRQSGVTELVSADSAGTPQNAGGPYPTKIGISGDGRFVTFASTATNLRPGDTGGSSVYIRDRASGTTERVSVNSSGAPPDGPSYFSSVSDDGRYVAFESMARNFVAHCYYDFVDLWRRDRAPSEWPNPMTNLCVPGVAGVIGCPCANPPVGPDRGCDNSFATGGAMLLARGVSSLEADGVVFSTDGEPPNALSILMQGRGDLSSGTVYGQGVLCVRSHLKRLFTKTAIGGIIAAPEFSIGEPQIHYRSAGLGDIIRPGQRRCYFVYYRDPFVLGGCPSGSTFNTTQAGMIFWSY